MKFRHSLLAHWLLALCCLASPGQLHGLLHHEDSGPDPISGVQELHDGDCSHFPEREPAHEECLLCSSARLDVAPEASVSPVEVEDAAPPRALDLVVDRLPIVEPHGGLGARAPPRLG